MSSERKQYELIFSLEAALGSNFTSTMTAAQKAATTLQSNIKSLNTTNGDITSYAKKEAALASSREKMERLQEEHQRLQTEIENTETPSRSLLTAMERNERQMDVLNSEIIRQEGGLRTLADRLEETGVDTGNLTAEQERLNSEMQEAIRIQNEYNAIEKAQATNNAAIDKTKSQLGTAVGTTVAASAAVYAFAVAPTMEYEQQMAVVQSITNATEEEMKLLDATAKEMGQTTSYSAKQSAEAMEYLGMAGWNVQQSVEGLPGVLALAAASGGELGATADIISNGVSAFGLEVSQSEQYANLLAQASRSANTDVSLMGETFEKVGSLAGTMGYSVEDLAFASTLMASTGLAGAEAGTQLKSSIANLASPTKAMQTAMDAYGISLTDSSGEMKPFKTLIDDMRDSFGELSAAEQASAATTIFGKEAMAGMLTIINASEEEYQRLTDAVYDYDGAAQEMADIRLDTLSGDMQLLSSATESLQLALGEALLPTVRNITQSITEVMVNMARWVAENQELAVVIVKVGAGLSALVIGVLSAKLVLLQLYGAYLAIKKAMLMAQIGQSNLIATLVKMSPALVAIAAVGAAIYMICNHLEEVRDWIEKTFGSEALGRFDTFIGHVQNLGEVIKTVLSGDLETAKQQMADAFGEGGLIIFETFETAVKSVQAVIPILVENVTGLLSAILPLFAQLGAALIPVMAEVINTLVPIIGTLGVAFVTIAGEVIPIFIETISFVAFCLTNLIEGIGKVVDAFGAWASENPKVIQFLTTVVTAVMGLKTAFTVATGIVTGVTTAVGIMGSGVTAIITTIMGSMSSAMIFISNILTKMTPFFNVIYTGLEWVVKGFNAVKAAMIAHPLIAFVAVLAAVGAAIYYVCTHLEEVRGWIEKSFGSEALAYFDGFVAMVLWLKDSFLESVENIAKAVCVFKEELGKFVEDGIQCFTNLGEGIASFVSSSISFFISLAEYLGIGFMVAWQAGWDLVIGTLTVVQTAFSAGVAALLAILNGIIEFIMGVFVTNWTTAWNLVQTLFSGVMDVIGTYIETYKTILDGLIQFITGVFTGNWSAAWEGIRTIFSGVFEGIKSICSSVMNTIVNAINTVIGGLNGLSIPDWVPGVGGATLSIPLIPQFAKGTERTPDTFIAGEAGAELITGQAGKKVFTAAQTGAIFTNIEKAQNMLKDTADVTKVTMVLPVTGENDTQENKDDKTGTTAPEVQLVISLAPILQKAIEANKAANGTDNTVIEKDLENAVYVTSMLSAVPAAVATNTEIQERESMVATGNVSTTHAVNGGGNQKNVTITINSAPVITVNGGGSADGLEDVISKNNEKLKEEIKRELEEESDDQKRRAYD